MNVVLDNLSGAYTGNASFVAPMYSATTESGLTFNNLTRKRARETPLTFLGEDISSQIQQQTQEVDRLLVYHAEKVRAEVMERRRRFWRQALAAVDLGISKRLKAKEDEIERIGKMNWALEERIRSLCVENQIWRDLAQSNEVAANVLRCNLEQVLAAQVRVKEEQLCEAEDAESCCCGDNGEDDEQRHDTVTGGMTRRVCRNCGEGEPSVLLLPCRHLCLCNACGPTVNACPVCNCSKDGSVNVNVV